MKNYLLPLLDPDLFEADLLEDDFLAAVFVVLLAPVFLAADLLPAVFLAPVLFVPVFFDGDLRAADFDVVLLVEDAFLAAVLREVPDFFAAVFLPVFLRAVLRGTFSPSSRASESPIATACFLDFTLAPEPDFNFPCLNSRITFSTLRPAPLEYFAIICF